MRNDDDQFIANTQHGFHAWKSIGQGDTTSTLIWTAAYDILFTVLKSDSKVIPSTIGECQSSMLAYADDLITLTTSKEELQVMAEKISNYSAISSWGIAIISKLDYVEKREALRKHIIEVLHRRAPSLDRECCKYCITIQVE
jgi:hypothetical protein